MLDTGLLGLLEIMDAAQVASGRAGGSRRRTERISATDAASNLVPPPSRLHEQLHRSTSGPGPLVHIPLDRVNSLRYDSDQQARMQRAQKRHDTRLSVQMSTCPLQPPCPPSPFSSRPARPTHTSHPSRSSLRTKPNQTTLPPSIDTRPALPNAYRLRSEAPAPRARARARPGPRRRRRADAVRAEGQVRRPRFPGRVDVGDDGRPDARARQLRRPAHRAAEEPLLR